MPESSIDEQASSREMLKTKRNLLFKDFERHPLHTRLAIEIRLIDDQIAEASKNPPEKKVGDTDRSG
jgi:hypothetical protein